MQAQTYSNGVKFIEIKINDLTRREFGITKNITLRQLQWPAYILQNEISKQQLKYQTIIDRCEQQECFDLKAFVYLVIKSICLSGMKHKYKYTHAWKTFNEDNFILFC